ncbi:glycosyltransferase family 2 protein [Exidia glandulosa HHB12029]|uniref:Glycosyltransferase family 2 protein n=1 Tax=Exidia glandulosa HHB12029 TaxID=1314781 RepID=A0A166B0M3_EXIGL|nr:glycosyltransferase family 2 protein [Exidia glandulosa HHB12029]
MGGMGTIHEANDFRIFRDNNAMTLNVVEASRAAGVRLFLLASSACVYPDHLQSDPGVDVKLKETDAFDQPPPRTQGLYGLEKLVGELILQNAAGDMQIRIARLHNVYGPGGTWHGGREKAPAAFARKAVAACMLGLDAPEIEMWGTGQQRRSFLYIDDAVLGVASRCSDNSLVRKVLGWEPAISLQEGMQRTVQWIRSQISDDASEDLLRSYLRSEVVQLADAAKIFAILLPVTSRGSSHADDCLNNLKTFAATLRDTTWRDSHSLGGQTFRARVYLLIDDEDEPLKSGRAEEVLLSSGIHDVRTLLCHEPRGHVCALWRLGAATAWRDGCDYFVLMGDDVQLLDEGWMRQIHAVFSGNVVPGFGCLSFTDISFPGMPTFPVVSRVHMDIFVGRVIPEVFVNQDGDPFLFQLYRRFDASQMLPLRRRNSVGGSGPPRYDRRHAIDWTFEPLDRATTTVESWLASCSHNVQRLLTLDVIVPSFRVPLETLDTVLSLTSSPTCSVMFIVIIDDPLSSAVSVLEARHGHRSDVRIRVNPRNLGASATRNRGLAESAGEWVHFLDDDVDPAPNLLLETELAIRAHPDAAGFVGTVHFPVADTIFKTAVHLSGVTYFWDIAQKMPQHADLPWGVTASLIARRNLFKVEFDLRYPKTGGGEDIHFCILKRHLFIANGLAGFHAAPRVQCTHPWWNKGRRSYSRFHNWSIGDGSLALTFPQHSYQCYYPTSAELLSLTILGTLAGLAMGSLGVVRFGVNLTIAAVLANVVHDLLRHLVLERTVDERSTASRIGWAAAIVEGTFIRIWSEAGRLRGQVQRRELNYRTYGRRFDWFAGRIGPGPIDHERRMLAERFFTWLAMCVLLCS